MAMISIQALYNFYPKIFDDFTVPDGIRPQDVIDNITFECAELSLIYTDPLFMRAAIKQWCTKELKVWEKLYATENFEYNPIWNVDGTVIERETNRRDKNGNLNRRLTGSESSNDQISESVSTESNTTGTSNSTDTKSVTGYNSDTWQAHEKDVVSGSTSENANGNTNRNMTDTLRGSTEGTENVDDVENENVARDLETRRTGNIGVTTTQQMIREEREVAQFNTIDYITNSFKKRFCVMVY